jgi:uncharacterized protein (UPF0147 family)
VNTLPNKNESIHQFIIDEEYARLREKQKHDEALRSEEEQPAVTSQVAISITLEELSEEEAALLSERDQLLRTKQELEYKIAEQIENKKSSIAQLRADILEIKQENQTLEAALGLPISK